MRNLAHNGSAGGILEPFWQLLDKTLAAAQNRLELFRVEAQEEKIRFMETFLLASAIVILGTLALAVATFTIAIYIWQSGPEIALAIIISTYAFGAVAAWRLLQARLISEKPFAGSAAELEKDRACISHREVWSSSPRARRNFSPNHKRFATRCDTTPRRCCLSLPQLTPA